MKTLFTPKSSIVLSYLAIIQVVKAKIDMNCLILQYHPSSLSAKKVSLFVYKFILVLERRWGY